MPSNFTGSIAELFATMGLDASGFTQGLSDVKVGLLSAEQSVKVYQEAIRQLTRVMGVSINEANQLIFSHVEAWGKAEVEISSHVKQMLAIQADASKRQQEIFARDQSAINEVIRLEKERFSQRLAIDQDSIKRQQEMFARDQSAVNEAVRLEKERAAQMNALHAQAIADDRAREASLNQMTAGVVRNLNIQKQAEKDWATYINTQHAAAIKEDEARNATLFGGRITWMQRMIFHMAAFAAAYKTLQLIEQAFGEFANLQRATIALTHMTGSVEQANEVLQALRVLSVSDALDFQHLIKAQLRFTEFGVSLEKVAPIMEAAANAAAAMNKPFDEVSNSLERMTESGVANARQLATVGISLKDLGEVLGVASSQVAEVFKDLTPTQRAQAFTEVLGKLHGIAKDLAGTLGGEWVKVKNEFSFAMTGMAESMSPFLTKLLQARNLVPLVGAMLKYMGGGGPSSTASIFTTEGVQEGGGLPGGTPGDFGAETGRPNALEAGLKRSAADILAANAARLAYEDMLKAERTLNNQVVELLNSQSKTYEEYTARLTEGGRTAKQSLSSIQTEIQKVSSEMKSFSGQPLKDAQGLLVFLEAAKIKAKEFADRDAVIANLRFFHVKESSVAEDLAITKLDALTEAQRRGWITTQDLAQAQINYNKVFGYDFPTYAENALTLIDQINQKWDHQAQTLQHQKELLRGAQGLFSAEALLGSLNTNIPTDAYRDARTKDSPLGKALLASGISRDDGEIKRLDNLRAVLQSTASTAKEVNSEWEQTSYTLTRLARVDLKEAISLWDQYIQREIASGATTGRILQLQEQELALIVQEKTLRGESTTAQLIQLENVRFKLEAMTIASQRWGKAYADTVKEITNLTRQMAVDLVNGLAKIWDTSGNKAVQKQIDDLDAQRKDRTETYLADEKEAQDKIVKLRAGANLSIAASRNASQDIRDIQDKLAKEKAAYDKFMADNKTQNDELRKQFQSTWDKIGDAFKGMVENFGKALAKFAATKIIETVFSAPLASLGNIITGGLGKIFGAGGSAVGGIANAASVNAGIISETLGGGASAAGGVASAAGGIGGAAASSTLSGVLGFASLGVSIASGIVSGIQGARLNNLMAEVEESTRYAKGYLFNLNTIELTYLPNLLHLTDIWGAILDMPNKLIAAPGAGGGGDTYIFQAGSISVSGGTSLTEQAVGQIMTNAVRQLKLKKGLRA